MGQNYTNALLSWPISELMTASPPTNSIEDPMFIGVDVGGTNVKFGIADSQGNELASSQFPTEQERGPQYAIDRASEEVRKLVASIGRDYGDVVSAGLGTPGTMDIPAGMILAPPNLSGWRYFNVRDGLSDALRRPVTYTNDANAAAYGEFWAGGGQSFNSMVLFTLGTGVGGGIIMDDHWVDGAHSHGAEVGHIVIDTSEDARVCGCGTRGHLEAYTSATSLVARANEQIETGVKTTLRDLPQVTALEISKAAEAGDAFSIDLVMETANYLARGVAIMAHIIDPEAIILGGAMNFGGNESELGRKFRDRIVEKIQKWTFPTVAKNLTIDFAQLGSAAGWVGAAGLSRVEYLNQASKTTPEHQKQDC